ncbi:hypothetical protein MLD38_013671 [Melastoma candidum]|uniref:Uncharacterized protein n=1 Tax=Melastoma candidum TaxID=119954 RepID=A0ACB9RC61_9MYRT|nr:hypothetical protein MLD38_013671 [Melastoma candidum]
MIVEMATGRPPLSNGQSHPEATLVKIASSDEIPRFLGIFSKDGTRFSVKVFGERPEEESHMPRNSLTIHS